jgi:hypothetical protein
LVRRPYLFAFALRLCACADGKLASDTLDEAASNAIVSVGPAFNDPAHCSGVMIARDRVATARHCLQEEPLFVRIGEDPAHPLAVARASIERVDDRRDLLFLRVDIPAAVARSVAPLTVLRGAPARGEPVLLGGFGSRLPGQPRRKHIHQGTVLQVQPDRISVETDGGACRGDSGGPLIANVHGHFGVYAVLWAGSLDGRKDVYTRLGCDACTEHATRTDR